MPRGVTLPLILVIKKVGGKALTDYTRDVRAARRATRKMAKDMKVDFGDLTGIMQGSLVTTAAAGAGLFAFAKQAGDFRQSLAAAGFATEATAAQMKLLENAAFDTEIAMRGVSANDAAKALREIGAEGLNAAEAARVLKPAIDLAAASFGEMSPEKAGGLVVQTMRIFNIEADKARQTADKLTRASTVSAIRLEKLNLFMGIAATGAEAFGASLTDTLTAASLIRGIIPRVERGSTALRGLFDDLADKQRQAKLESELGVQVIDKQTGKFRNLFDVVTEVKNATANMTDAQREAKLQNIFQIEAIAGLRAMMVALDKGIKDAEGNTHRGADAIKFYRSEIDNSEGATKKLADLLRNTFSGALNDMREQLRLVAIAIGDTLKFAIPLFLKLSEAIGATAKWFMDLPRPVKMVMGLFVGLTVIAGMLSAAVLGIGLAMGSVQKAALVAIPAIKAFFATVILGSRRALVKLGIVGAILMGLGFLLESMGAFDKLFGTEGQEIAALQSMGNPEDFASPEGGTDPLGAGRVERFMHQGGFFKSDGTMDVAKINATLSPEQMAKLVKAIERRPRFGLYVDGDKIGQVTDRRDSEEAERRYGQGSRV